MSVPPDRRKGADIAADALMTFRAPKAGEMLKDCQDAFYTTDNGRYAVADGVTQSALPAEWAAILAKHACERGAPESKHEFEQWLAPARRLWDETRRRIVEERPDHYWITGKSSVGASTLMLLELFQPAGRQEITWRAFAVGDSCLFLVRDGRAHMSLPLQNWRDFGSRPASISTAASPLPPYILFEERCRAGDCFLLATDALSKWVCAEIEQGGAPFETIDRIPDEQTFRAFIDDERAARRMDNDDVTLVWLKTATTLAVALSASPSRTSAPVEQSRVAAVDEAEEVPPRAVVTREAPLAGTDAASEEIPEMRRVLVGAAVVSALVSIATSAIFNIGLRHLETTPLVRPPSTAVDHPTETPPKPQRATTPPPATTTVPAAPVQSTDTAPPNPAPGVEPQGVPTEGWVICPDSDCVVSEDKKTIRTNGRKSYHAHDDPRSPKLEKIPPGEYVVKRLHESQHWALIDLTPKSSEVRR